MKILQINSSDTGGGAERVAYQINCKLNEQYKINSKLLVRNKERNDETIIQLPRSFSDKVITRIVNNYMSFQGKVALGSIKYNKTIFKEGYDIVHYHNIHSNYYNFNNIKKIASKIPVVWTLHDMWAFTGRCTYSYDCIHWMYNCGKCEDKINTFPAMKIDNSSKVLDYKKRAFMSNNIQIITPSKWLENLARKSFMKNMNIKTIYNGVDIDLYKYNEKDNMREIYNLNKDKIYILLISANINDPRKGFKNIIEVLNKVENKDRYGILLVGKELDNNVIDNSFELIQFGYIKDENKLNQVYSLADIFIMPTLADNFPCTILESMSSGTPVMSFNIGGIPEQITDKTGWLLEPLDNEGILNIINNLQKDECQEKGKLARLRVEKYFSLEKCINEYIKLYNSIV